MTKLGLTKDDFWKRPDIDRIMKFRDEDKLSWPEIAPHFPDKTVRQIRSRYHGELAVRRTKASRVLTPSTVTARTRQPSKPREVVRIVVPEHTSLTAELLGDPRPGRSALDKKRAGITEPRSRDPYHRTEPQRPTLATRPAS